MDTEKSERQLDGKELLLIHRVLATPGLGHTASVSVEAFLRRETKHLAALDQRQIARVRQLAEDAGVQLPQ
jgi:hypothetical protein